MKCFAAIAVLALIGGIALACEPPRSPRSPAAERDTFRLAAGLRIELVAAEPEVESPVAAAFDEDGRLWVVELRDYPNGPPPGGEPEGRIKVLEDRDGDGRFETSRVFAEKLLFANGIMPWKRGAIVTMAPRIVRLAESGQVEDLYLGFSAGNPQLRVSHPILGVDGWVTVANGLRGGAIRPAIREAPALPLAGKDFRFHPVEVRAETISGMGQYGNCFDRWGERFVCDNHHHLRHVVLPDGALRRNPFLAVHAVLHDVPGPIDTNSPNAGVRVYPISRNWTTAADHAGRFTAACSNWIDTGGLLTGPYSGAAFTCEPTGNLVHAERLAPHGATFRSSPVEKGVEFLASTDEWFRPVFLTHDPEGALIVVDMYRAVIEHPEWMPDELKNRPDLLHGKDNGRIWRIVTNENVHKPVRPLSSCATAELVALLADQNSWRRSTAQRLLLERQDRACIKPLQQLLSSASAEAVIHAVWLLDGFAALDEMALARVIGHRHARVREHAIRIASPKVGKSNVVRDAVMQRAGDGDARVRFQTALTLGEVQDDHVVPVLAAIARRDSADVWMRRAITAAVPTRSGMLFELIAAERASNDSGSAEMLRELAKVAGARRDPAEVTAVLRSLLKQTDGRLQIALLNGVAEGMLLSGGKLDLHLASRVFVSAARNAMDVSIALDDRIASVRLLGHAAWDTAIPPLTTILSAVAEPQALQLAAVRAIAAHSRDDAGAILLKNWHGYAPAIRVEICEALLQRSAGQLALVRALEAGDIKPLDLDPQRAERLMRSKTPDVRERAGRVLRDSQPADRKAVLAEYQAALKLSGNSTRGRTVFEKHCSACHQLAGIGARVGPDISDLGRTKSIAQLLNDVLNPNAAVDGNYIRYTVTTKSGKTFVGVFAVETATSVTVQRDGSATDSILRHDIESIESSRQSLMPEGMEKLIAVPEMADLLAFLKNWRDPFGTAK